ncbi:hypothetical protein H0264_29105 [Nocardia huaxiensis]|uniref:DUF8176 domain-containing protein n=1 Tax=Nocardia huaxiensis TaxID=2755382 RepID=A0A7D6Z0C2_9NOCA|nr:hypothetical protein [Nocardia huaxiensis]QLY29306.1 hypothetical protein H0264_29105 [Nocardia huaxiensis]
MIEQEDATESRPPMPALPVTDEPETSAPAEPGWAQWLSDDKPGVEMRKRKSRSSVEELLAEDPMAPLVVEARRRAAANRHRRQVRDRVVWATVGVLLVLVTIVGLVRSGGEQDEPETATAAVTSLETTAAVNQPGLQTWCRETTVDGRISGAGQGDTSTAPGVIMQLEYAWYVLKDPIAVRALLAPDARVASEQATRDAISAIPAGTQHCVTITALAPDRWDVTVGERHADGTQASWQQIMTTTVRDGKVLISAIIAGTE